MPMLTRRRVTRLLLNAAALLLFVVTVFPIYWMVATGFKRGVDILSFEPKWLPFPATLDNYRTAIGKPFFTTDVVNSMVVVAVTVLVSLGLAFLAALAAARFHFSGRKLLVVMLIVVQMVPLEALIIPIYLMLDRAGQTDRLAGIIVTYMTFVLPFTIWTLRGFIINIPMELEEAAMVDGCTRAGAFRRILFPLVAPGLVATAVFSFILVWNDYLIAYVLLQSPERQTLGIWLASFTTNPGTDWGGVMAGSTLYAIPVVVFFLLVQRRVVSGLTAGAVKG
ncbi:MAG TPA: carbohydrate ABC transporter permease [Actinomycetota bacterium]|nr:carbohydrate ABC transporter permease [Actinomycetota bacterium]